MTLRQAQAGSLESSDCLVIVAPARGFALDYRGQNQQLFAERTEKLVKDLVTQRGLNNLQITIQDQGALELTLKARIETALHRATQGGDW